MTNSPAPLDHDLQRILAVRLDNAGDVVMLGPALRALRAFAPAGHLALLASPVGAQAAELLPEVDEVITVRAVWQDASDALAFDPDRERRLVQRLADGRFDAAFIFTSFSQSPFPAAYACYLAHVPVRAGQPGDFGGAVLSHRVPSAPGGSHQVDRNLHLLEHLGIPVPSRALRVSLTTRARGSGRQCRARWPPTAHPA